VIETLLLLFPRRCTRDICPRSSLDASILVGSEIEEIVGDVDKLSDTDLEDANIYSIVGHNTPSKVCQVLIGCGVVSHLCDTNYFHWRFKGFNEHLHVIQCRKIRKIELRVMKPRE
jgi:hypothetical protein